MSIFDLCPHRLLSASLVLSLLACSCGKADGNADDSGNDGQGAADGAGANGSGNAGTGGDPSQGGNGTSSGGNATGGNAAGGNGGTGGEGPACPAPSSPKSFELGTGEDCFERLDPLETIPLMSGPQGGYHLWISIGCVDCDSPMHVKWGVIDPSTGMTLHDTYETEAMVDLLGQPFRQRAGMFCGMPGIQWDPEAYPPVPEGTHVIMWAHLLDDAGNVLAEDEREVIIGETVVWDPCAENPEAPECQQG